MLARAICIVVGCLFGNVLTAEVVARAKLGKSARNVGSGNPGMANIGAVMGTKWAAVVLLGDVAKTLAACMLARWLVAPELGQLAMLYAGVGAAIGHNFPLWMHFRGGKGVAVTCAAIFFFDPVIGGLCCLAGFLVVLATRYLCWGAVAITVAFAAAMLAVAGAGEAFALACVLLALMLVKHGAHCLRALQGSEPKSHLFKGGRS